MLAISIIINLLVSSFFALQAYILLIIGPVYFLIVYLTFNDTNARHYYESETKYRVHNIKRKDEFIKHRYELSNHYMYGANNKRRDG